MCPAVQSQLRGGSALCGQRVLQICAYVRCFAIVIRVRRAAFGVARYRHLSGQFLSNHFESPLGITLRPFSFLGDCGGKLQLSVRPLVLAHSDPYASESCQECLRGCGRAVPLLRRGHGRPPALGAPCRRGPRAHQARPQAVQGSLRASFVAAMKVMKALFLGTECGPFTWPGDALPINLPGWQGDGRRP